MSDVVEEFLEALAEEYLRGTNCAVGIFLGQCDPSKLNDSRRNHWLRLEDRLRGADDKNSELRSIRQELLGHSRSRSRSPPPTPPLLPSFPAFMEIVTKPSACPTPVEEFVRCNSSSFPRVATMEGFTILGMPQGSLPAKTDVEQIWKTAVQRFHWLIYNDDGSVRSQDMCKSLRDNLTFCCGNMCDKLPWAEDDVLPKKGVFCMSMKCDEWPFNPSFDGQFGKQQLERFVNSLWRPSPHCAVWEETFHTITEAFERLSRNNQDYAMYSFEPKGKLGTLMQQDIDAGTYDTEKQNRMEGGAYDFRTAVNEYVHQCWLVHYAGHRNWLMQNPSKAGVVSIMERTPGMPLRK